MTLGATATAYERLLDQLRATGKTVRAIGTTKATAQCPAHDDHNPSLSITKIEGQALLHCHAGCHPEDILAAIQLDKKDLYDDREGATYTYEDHRTVHRTWNKKFRQTGNTNGNKTSLYRLTQLKAAISEGRTVYLVEGEKDVHAIETLGEVATTAPMGAKNIDKCNLTPLHGAQVVAIVDKPNQQDDNTGETWARHLRGQLIGKTDIRFVQAKEGKDAADHIAAGHTLDQLEPYTFPVSPLLAGIKTADWLGAQIIPPLRWVIPEIIPEGYTLLVGAPKIGKSWLSMSIALAVASGGYMFGTIYCGRPRPVLLLALEDSDRRLQSRIRKLEPQNPDWPPALHYITNVDNGYIAPIIEEWLTTIPTDQQPLIILDTIGKVIPPALMGESQYQRDYRFSSRLQAIASQRPGMALIGLHHDRKANTDDFVESISGTNGIAGAADTILLINRPRTEAEGLLKITGRDVEENEYGVKLIDGTWTLLGNNLYESIKAARTVHATVGLGEQSAEVVEFVADHPDGVRAGEVADAIGMSPKDATTYLLRLYEAGRIRRPKRGLYTPVESVVSVVNNPTETTETTQTTGGIGYAHAREGDRATCQACGNPMRIIWQGQTMHPACGQDIPPERN
jgi:AAA domain